MIKEALSSKRVLLVLDDVDQLDQLNAVLAMRDWIKQGSKIIITSRNEQLLKAHELCKVHKVEELKYHESLQLFSWHAFGQDHPIEVYMEHSQKVVEYCGGLPLALQVLGSSLSGRSVEVWESAIKKLKGTPNRDIIEKLKISFDSLEDDHDQNLFLDIACFFVRKNQTFVITVLDGCEYCTRVGIDNLIKRCLLSVDEYNELTMHQMLQDMGREIVRQKSPKEPGKRSRVWQHEDASNVLREKTGTDTIEGLVLDLQISKENRPDDKFFDLNNEKRYHSENHPNESTLLHRSFLSWIPVTVSASTSNDGDIQTDAFSRMHNLRLLQLNNVILTGNYKQFPKKLRWLCWHGFSLKVMPIEFSLERLVVLEMQHSSLKQLWQGNKLLGSLKVLNLSHSHDLTNTSDFSRVPNLESLILEDCVNLIEVHESIGELEKLVLLNLKGCKNLMKIPSKIGQLKSLKNLILFGCSKLFNLHRELDKIDSLKMLDADQTATSQSLLMATKVRVWLSHLWYWPSGPSEIRESMGFSLPHSLTSLNLAYCNLSDDVIPMFLGSLSLLEKLDLSGNPISGIPESIKCLTMLRSLKLVNCRRLESLPELPISFKKLFLRECIAGAIANLKARGSEKLIEIQGMYKLKPIGEIDEEMISNLGFPNLKFLENVEVNLFNHMTSTGRKVLLQGLYECGIFSTFVPGSAVPDGFNFKSRGSSISFKVPSVLPNLKIQGFNVCVVYSAMEDFFSGSECWDICSIEISNTTKGLTLMYEPTFLAIPEDENKDMIWLSHWKFKSQLEVGDEVKVNVEVIKATSGACKVKELGIHVVLEREGYNTTSRTGYNTTNPYNCHQYVDDANFLSPYHQWHMSRYLLCHHDWLLHSTREDI